MFLYHVLSGSRNGFRIFLFSDLNIDTFVTALRYIGLACGLNITVTRMR